MKAKGISETRNTTNWYNELIKLRDNERERKNKATMLVKGNDLVTEVNPQGMMKWYMHPGMDDTAHKVLVIYVQEIPRNSRSGRQKYQGGMVIFIIEGQGYTVIDDEKYPWAQGDTIQLPLKPEGVIFQHFNTSPDKVAKLIAVEPNLVGALGVDRGSGFEQLENAPEYQVDRREKTG